MRSQPNWLNWLTTGLAYGVVINEIADKGDTGDWCAGKVCPFPRFLGVHGTQHGV